MQKFIVALMLVSMPFAAFCDHKPQKQIAYWEVDTHTLKRWYDQNKPMIILDTRSREHFDNTLLPAAKWLPYNASDAEIQAIIPAKNSLIVVYCWSSRCPASEKMAKRLNAMGYTNVHKYGSGLEVWMEKGYPTQQQ